jgi:tetratricopeptide (TPR) repeat protein
MNLTGVLRFPVVFASALVSLLVFAAAPSLASDCAHDIAPEARISQFKHLDQQAEAAMHARHFSEAVGLYERAVCLVPDSARGWYGLAMAQAAINNFSEARKSFETADRLQPGSPMPLEMQVRMNFGLHDMEALKSNLRALAERFPNNAATHQNIARYLAEQNLLDLSLAEALRAEQASPGDPMALLELAGLENTAGAYKDAVRNSLAVQANAELPQQLRAAAAGIAALSYQGLAKPDDAIRAFKESIALDPARENSYLALANLYDQLHRYSDEAELLTRAKDQVLGSPAILLGLGTALVRAEKFQEGTAILRSVLQQMPDAEQAYLALADASRKTGNSAAEVETLRHLEARKPDYPMIHVLIARALLNEASVDYPGVLRELSLAQKQSSSDPDIFYLRGRVYADQKRYVDAISDLQHAIELNPLETGAHYQLARIYQKLGKQELAREEFARERYLTDRSQ